MIMPFSVSSRRPGLAIIANCITPYRVNLHSLVAGGIPELKLHTLISHGPADFDWKVELPVDIHVSYFGPADNPNSHAYVASLSEWRKGARLIDYLQQHDVRAVICGLPRYLSYLRVIMWCRRNGVPAFVNSDANVQGEKSLPSLKKQLKAFYHRWWIKCVAGVMPMGALGEQYFRQYGAAPNRMYRVPYTPDYDYYSAVELERLTRFRGEHRLDVGRRYLVYSGRLVHSKRVDLLIDAFAQIADRRPSWDLLIVGTGELRDHLQQQIPKQIESRVRWLGFLPQGELALAYHAGDVLVLPSDREPWALVIQEGMAAGMVVVASDAVGAARELIGDRNSGRIFQAGSITGLVSALLDVTKDEKVDWYKAQSRSALLNWINKLDPVAEIRRALTEAGVLDKIATSSTVAAVP